MLTRFRAIAEALCAATLPGGGSLFRVLSGVNGYLYPQEAVFLYQLARKAPGEGLIIEIGSFHGKSTLCLAIGARPRKTPVVSIDPHINGSEPLLRYNLRRFEQEDMIDVRVESSLDVAAGWETPARIVFIDGAHDLPSIEADVEAWLPHIVPGGFLLIHDSTELSGFEGPRRVAKQLFSDKNKFAATGSIGSTSWGQVAGSDAVWSPPQYGKAIFDNSAWLMRRILRRAPTIQG